MNDSAGRMAKANNALINADTEEEKARAQQEFVKAEIEHLQKLGVPFRQRFSTAIPLVLILLLAVSLVVGILTARDTNTVAADLAENVQGTCERGNDSRANSLGNYRNDVDGLRADLANLRADMDYLRKTGLDGSSELLVAKRDAIMAKEKQIREKKVAIARLIESQAPAAVKPGSVRVTCP